MHLNGSGQDLVRGSRGVDRFQEGDVDLVLLILGFSLEFESFVGEDDGRVFHVCKYNGTGRSAPMGVGTL